MKRNRNVVFSDETTDSEKIQLTTKEKIALGYYRTLDKLRNNFVSYVLVLVAIVIVIQVGRAYMRFQDAPEIQANEIRFYVTIALTMLGVCTFAILRLYNSVVQNTSALLGLKHAVKSNNTSLKENARAYDNASKLWVRVANTLNNNFKRLTDSILKINAKD